MLGSTAHQIVARQLTPAAHRPLGTRPTTRRATKEDQLIGICLLCGLSTSVCPFPVAFDQMRRASSDSEAAARQDLTWSCVASRAFGAQPPSAGSAASIQVGDLHRSIICAPDLRSGRPAAYLPPLVVERQSGKWWRSPEVAGLRLCCFSCACVPL